MRALRFVPILVLAAVAACRLDGTRPIVDPGAPANLAYELMPSGDPLVPLGLLLWWDPPANGRALTYQVYARSGAGAFGLRATTTSPSFHDAGIPQSEYFVVARDAANAEMGRSTTVFVDERLRLGAPAGLISITLNREIQLRWSDNAFAADPEIFDYYRVYSAAYDFVRNGCGTQWFLEGTTAGEAFTVGNLENGVPLCFAVSAVSISGHESLWSNLRIDTPRWDAKNVRVYAAAIRPDSASFLFFEAGTHRTGVVADATRPDADIVVQRLQDGTLWLVPAREGVASRVYGEGPVPELTSIDRAPTSGFQSAGLQAIPGFGYVFRLTRGGDTHYAGLRIAYTTADYVVFDWSYQSAPGNPDLSRK